MKKAFIPKGEVVRHSSLYTDKLIVKGVLLVDGEIVAKEIIGDGVIEARHIICDSIRTGVVTADKISSRKIAVNKLFVRYECWATDCIAVSDFIGAGYVSTGKLSMSLSDIRAVNADEIITLPQKRRGLLGLLWSSWWKSLFLSLRYSGEENREGDEKPENEPAPDEQTQQDANASEETPAGNMAERQNGDLTEMLISILEGLRENGYKVSKTETPDTGDKNAAA